MTNKSNGWENKRKEWRNRNTWEVTGDVKQRIYSYIKQLNYEIEYAADRNILLHKILSPEEIAWLTEYISSPLFAKKQIKTKGDFLSENDISLIGFSTLVDYLVFPKYKTEDEEQQSVIKKRKSDVYMQYGNDKEVLFGDRTDINENEVSKEPINYNNLKVSKKQKLFKVETKQKITKEDIEDILYLKQIDEILTYLGKRLGYLGLTKEERKLQELFNIEVYGQTTVNRWKNLYSELKWDSVYIKEKIRGTIYFKRITKGTTEFVFDQDTGYFKDDEYILVSENKIDFTNEKHILALLNNYSDLKQSVEVGSEMWAIMHSLEEIIENVNFEPHVKDILIYKIDDMQNLDIAKELLHTHHIELSDVRISQIYYEDIPKKIVDTYKQMYEDWLYTYKVKGTYKMCSKCNEVKLMNEKYFRKRSDNKGDGFYNQCRKCEK